MRSINRRLSNLEARFAATAEPNEDGWAHKELLSRIEAIRSRGRNGNFFSVRTCQSAKAFQKTFVITLGINRKHGLAFGFGIALIIYIW